MKNRFYLALLFLANLTCYTVYSQNSLNIMDNFYHSGYMGCIDNIHVVQNYNAGSNHEHCLKITSTVCPENWSGVYWQYPANNWCDTTGMDLSEYSFTEIVFDVKGNQGGEAIQFKVGNEKCDSYSTFKKTFYLKNYWESHEISVSGKDLSNVSSSFGWFIDFKSNKTEVTFYIDNIRFE